MAARAFFLIAAGSFLITTRPALGTLGEEKILVSPLAMTVGASTASA